MEANNILSAKNLSFSYNQQKVLAGISFDIEKGSFISILGPNGAGKSTLVNIISKVLQDFSGEVTVGGKDIRAMSAKDLARMIAVVPQYTNPSFSFNVREMVMMGRHPYISRFGSEGSRDHEVVEEVMEKTKIMEFANRRFSELSGGEKQRVVLAQALAQESPILLLDEPTSHLDINFQIEFMNLFLDLNRKEEKTVIGIFHDINLAIQNSGMTMLLKDGKIYRFGKTEEVVDRSNLKNVFGSDVFVGKNPITGKLYVSPVFKPRLYTGAAGRARGKSSRIHIIGGGGAASPVINLLHEHGHEVSCGVINTFDTDLNTLKMLDIPYVVEAPFSPISDTAQDKNLEFIRASEVVILPEVEFGHGNFLNLVAVKEALSIGKKVIVIEGKTVKERDHTGGEASKLYKEIISGGAVIIKSREQIFSVL